MIREKEKKNHNFSKAGQNTFFFCSCNCIFFIFTFFKKVPKTRERHLKLTTSLSTSSKLDRQERMRKKKRKILFRVSIIRLSFVWIVFLYIAQYHAFLWVGFKKNARRNFYVCAGQKGFKNREIERERKNRVGGYI